MEITLRYEIRINSDDIDGLSFNLGNDYYFFSFGQWYDDEERNIITDENTIEELNEELKKHLIDSLKDDVCDTSIYDIANESQIIIN